MKVVHLSTRDRNGGAAIAAWRLHIGLLQLGVVSRMRVRLKYSDSDAVDVFVPPADWRVRLPRLWRRFWMQRRAGSRPRDRPFSDDRSEHGGSELDGLEHYDVVNLHWAAGFVDQPTLFERLPAHIPIVVTMHDMNSFTGGCHYTMGCNRFTDRCGSCPQLNSHNEHDLSRSVWDRKMRSYSQRSNVHFVADSEWLATEARRSSLLKAKSVRVIHYGLDTNVFRPIAKAAARVVLGLPLESSIVVFGADSLHDERKGLHYLIRACGRLKKAPVLLSFGSGHPPRQLQNRGLHLGAIESEHLLAAVYNAGDLFVIPSIQEAFGQTALEAMACGIPVVAFNSGGIADIVRHRETGLLCPPADVAALADALAEVLNSPALRQHCGINARRIIEEKFRLEQQAQAYAKLYTEASRH
jgi:glycosyltransferase involved in cell wall biosynthesis